MTVGTMTSVAFIACAVAGSLLFLPFAEFTPTSKNIPSNLNADRKQDASPVEIHDQILKLEVGKVVIDTDAGVDDATAILLALGEEKIAGKTKIVGITCVHGNTEIDHVVANVLKTLHTVNRLDIPVYRGAENPIHVTPKGDHYFGLDGFGDFKYLDAPDPRKHVQKKHAVQALIDIVSESPGEVTLLCIGPLTNIALAIRLDPLFLTKVRNLVVLGGSVEGLGNVLPGVEFNFYIDPEATFIVFNSTDTTVENISPIVLFPWESVVKRQVIPIDWRNTVLGRLDSPQVRLLNRADKNIANSTYYRSADSFAAAVTYRPDMVSAVSAVYVEVQYYGPNAGAVFVDYQNRLHRPINTVIVLNLDVELYKNMLVKDLS